MTAYTGKLDDIALYNRALTPQEIATNYNAKAAVASPAQTVSVVAPLTVNTTSDAANPGAGLLTFRQAVGQAMATGLPVQFDPSIYGQSITLSSFITFSSNVKIVGPGADKITIKAPSASQGDYGLFRVSSGVTADISGVTIDGGQGTQGGQFVTWGNLNLTNNVFKNATGVNGGSIIVGSPGVLTVKGSTFQNNYASSNGGAIYVCTGGSASVDGSTFTSNHAYYWGAIYLQAGAPLKVTNSTFTGNYTHAGGGAAIAGENQNIINISGSTFDGNGTPLQGSAIYAYNGKLNITDTNILNNNSSNTVGGAIYVHTETATLTRVNFTHNTKNNGAGDAGAIYVDANSTMNINDSKFISNHSDERAGAIRVASGATVNITGSNFTGNNAGYGGAIYSTGNLNIQTSTFDGNTAAWQAGAVMTNAASLNISRSTFSNNSTYGEGSVGGALFTYISTTFISNSTFAYNTSYYGGAIFTQRPNGYSDWVIITNSTIANNTAYSRGGGVDSPATAYTAYGAAYKIFFVAPAEPNNSAYWVRPGGSWGSLSYSWFVANNFPYYFWQQDPYTAYS
ncbi:MAG: right-handed parallel beta-helix repeat-containing protein, partial [Betaproteobacteria bacterium]